jgi:hypothetical protein
MAKLMNIHSELSWQIYGKILIGLASVTFLVSFSSCLPFCGIIIYSFFNSTFIPLLYQAFFIFFFTLSLQHLFSPVKLSTFSQIHSKAFATVSSVNVSATIIATILVPLIKTIIADLLRNNPLVTVT